MKYYDEKKQMLKDKKIIAALKKAADDYENGEIAEVQETLTDIVLAIANFTLDY